MIHSIVIQVKDALKEFHRMKLVELSIKNYKSIKKIETVRISAFQALIGENNVGKSNILYAIDAFLSANTGGVKEGDFNDKDKNIIIGTKFDIKSENLRRIWRPYTINNELILEKHLWIEKDDESEKVIIKSEYHGYKAEPKDWFLSIPKIKEIKGDRPKWKEIVKENNLPDYFLNGDKCNQADFAKGLARYLEENDVEYETPDMSKTQALGLQSNVIANLPRFHLLSAEANYSDETDKRSKTTAFRRLMGDLTDRIIKNDPKYLEIENALNELNNLLNVSDEKDKKNIRLTSLSDIESKIKDILCNLMPSVEKVKLRIILEDIKTIFSKGVEITVDDGVETDVLSKGHGLQRCIVFSLLQALILNERRQLIKEETTNNIDKKQKNIHSIILGVEEPELYIHPQLGKLFYDVLLGFSEEDQVIYSTHSPRFIDVYKYDSIARLSKTKTKGTSFVPCDLTFFKDLTDKKVFQGLTQLNSDVNELFFARNVILVEGAEDKIAITETLKKTKTISLRTEEIDVTVIVAGGKQSMPFFIRVLNAFSLRYAVLHDLDITEDMEKEAKEVHRKTNETIGSMAPGKVTTFPVKLEETVGLKNNHFKDQYSALKFFTNHENINNELEKIIKDALSILEIETTE